ncbi:DHHA1 domain-containing protein [Tumebacillus sp. DT12]|uniref:DHHA1 domain-containing protein n=1 Tax=Tumebacillus lacus TaxID=2995335 RepID=A0ABT3X1F1_9BACL|nr:DHHA1 domain-containing protein [Tumebacillus lacus]MCX7570720.1 DHHA1 domain-containing protein [Tumebacillus lacus]
MTRKLFYEDPYLTEFTATVTGHGTEPNDTPYVVLSETAFYPTGGGQPCDLGTLNGVQVVDVEEVDGEIRHRLDAPLLDVLSIEGRIDWTRRFDHMQQHTGQHILSAAFEQLFDGETVGFHLGREVVTVDITLPDLTQEIAEGVERLANSIVLADREILCRFVDKEELARMPLRKPPSVTENIRIVTVDGFDYSPCGGTHPARTGEIGMIKILGWEKYKGNVRVEFVCGWRTWQAMTDKQIVLRQLSRHLTAGEAELPDGVARLLKERKELEKALAEANAKLLEAEADTLYAAARDQNGVLLVAKAFEGRSMQELQRLGQRIASLDPQAVALLVTGGEKTQLVFARGGEVMVPMNELLKETLLLIDGKGGGNPSLAQGGGSAGKSAPDVLAHAERLLAARL